jgi:tetratricopeptide (TPR) repeat protein
MGKNNSNYATSLNNLADLYQSMGIYNESEQLYRKAQSIYKLSSGENDPSYAISKSNLGNLYIKMGKYLGARKVTERIFYNF